MAATEDSPAQPDPTTRQVRDLVAECLEAVEEEGEAAVDRICAEHPELATKIRERLQALVRMGLLSDAEAGEGLPERLGPYRILEEIGRGGMGSVYLAEQREPLRRRVALKVIRLGMDTRDLLARFEVERQALAMMDHPGIARVYDAGATERGRPYFAMEYVPGVAINRYCEQLELGTEQRIELFLLLCDAVQHAHQKGIIHRDLKPTNVLVSSQDQKPLPKIIDFGVAKAMNQRLSEATLYTETGRILGTPEYMSPEQAGEDDRDIDTRTDIYALGVMLYELLTGTLPFEPNRLRSGDFSTLRKILREEDPQRPSTRVSSVGVAGSRPDVDHRLAAKALAKRLRGDLDAIVLKALAKERNHRYATVQELAADLRRHLDHEPVLATAPSTTYRIRKFVRRYRGQVAAAAALLVSLLVGLGVSLWFFVEARQNAIAAQENLIKAEQNAIAARENLAKFDRLSVVVRLKRARQEAEQLLPAWPDKLPAMRAWLDEFGTPLQRALADLRESLMVMRTSGVAEPRPDPALQQRIDRLRAIHDGFQKELEKNAGDTQTALDVRQLVLQSEAATAKELAVLEAKQQTPRLYRFAEESDQFLHDALGELIDDLEQFAEEERGLLRFVEKNLQWASEVWQRSVDDHRGEWEQAIAAIRQDPRYGGLQLVPQVGLRPLWRNPQSGLWEFGHVRSGNGNWLLADEKTGNLAIDNQMGLVFVLLPGGAFDMGCQNDDPDLPNFDPEVQSYERPVHRVTLDAFFVAKYEVTQGQWIRLGGEWQSGHKALMPSGSQHELTLSNPAENITYDAALERLREHGLDLPTEAQWEYACRAGNDTVWSFGDELRQLRRHGNIADESAARYSRMQCENWNDTHVVHAPVGSFLPNAFGLYDVHGNIAEWCRDELAPYTAPVRKGDGLREANSTWRIARGGGFGRIARYTRSATRDRFPKGYRSADCGIRPVRAVFGK